MTAWTCLPTCPSSTARPPTTLVNPVRSSNQTRPFAPLQALPAPNSREEKWVSDFAVALLSKSGCLISPSL